MYPNSPESPTSSQTDDQPLNPDFRRQLVQSLRTPTERHFEPLRLGGFLVSVQASHHHASEPLAIVPPEDVNSWEVAVFTPEGQWVTPSTHPEVFHNPLWSQYWTQSSPGKPSAGRHVPTAVVQVFTDVLYAGRDMWERMIDYERLRSQAHPPTGTSQILPSWW